MLVGNRLRADDRCMKWNRAINNDKIIELILIYFPINFQLVDGQTLWQHP